MTFKYHPIWNTFANMLSREYDVKEKSVTLYGISTTTQT